LYVEFIGGVELATVMKDMKRPLEEKPEQTMLRSTVPHLGTTVAVLQDYTKPESFSIVDFVMFLQLCKIDQQACQVVSLIDGKRSIQDIADKAGELTKIGKTGQEILEFFRALRSQGVLEF
jgi:hypothetical protein